ncbi:hypothetical protein LEM8419_01468 [Neolewinella maritima]|uniref:Uncharacterized protein n=1 Tax=Neolewinella maritima TaxID=1383882 RepID=A0ABM9B0K2_9BACT|nr:YqgE/AlgH family protein [Neolewinella maritima]CAH1000315.1 hypothetical protein LEM8419_01468 [Neolewinella maritima]
MALDLHSGIVLLAEPFMLDSNFRRATVLLVEHTQEGSLGFILNRRVNMRVDQLVDNFPDFNAPIYYGGPVATDTVHYLHRKGDLIEGSEEISKGVYWGGNYEKLRALIAQGLLTPRDVRFFVGYSGWSPQQLLEELQLGSWVPAPMYPNYLFKTRPERLWSQVMSNKGSTFSVIAEMDEEVRFN